MTMGRQRKEWRPRPPAAGERGTGNGETVFSVLGARPLFRRPRKAAEETEK